MAQSRQALLILILTSALQASGRSQAPKFFDDDPIQAMPAPLPVATARTRDINEFYDFLVQSSDPETRPPSPAEAINTLGEVPDSEWFVNRHGIRRMSREELQRSTAHADSPEPPLTIISGKSEGIMSGFSMVDSRGRRYFAKIDPMRYPELATGADVIVANFLYAIGYNTPVNAVVNVNLSDMRLADTAKITLPDRRSRRMTWWDVEEFADGAHRYPDGSFRIVASPAVEGETIGPFEYSGTRRDDPNDIVTHENRRDLRGLYVYSAWLNHTDAKAANTLDTIVEENGVRFIRHYLIDFGSALGSDGDRPKSPRLGHEFILPTPAEVLTRMLTLGLVPEPWEQISFPRLRCIGNFESQLFDPDTWKSNYPNPAFLSRLPDDDFWAAKNVMAFTDDDIRAIVETARFSDPQCTEYMIATLAQRRDKIGRVFFSKVLPLDHFRIENAELVFDDLAVKYGFHAPRRYEIRWSRFNNISQRNNPIPNSGSTNLPVEMLHAAPGSYYSAALFAPDDQPKRVNVYLRKTSSTYLVVGIDRTW